MLFISMEHRPTIVSAASKAVRLTTESWLGARYSEQRRSWVGRACSRVCACVRACVRDVFAIYDNYILPRLIMIKIIILYIFHTNQTH